MSIIPFSPAFRQRVVKRSFKIGVTKAARLYHVSRNAIYEWRARYDGTLKSLKDKSHRPKHHPQEHTAEEKEMILRRYPRYKGDLIRLWWSLRQAGYTRTYYGMLRVIRKWLEPELRTRKKHSLKPYRRAAFPVPVREIQTDNGAGFTKALICNDPNDLSLFEEYLQKRGIIYHRIRVATPRHNGKVERQHREDQKRFYDRMRMFNLDDGQTQLARYNRISNDIPKTCLNFLTPDQVLYNYLSLM